MSTKPKNDAFENWTVQMRKGLLEWMVLRALVDGECYGYDLVKSLIRESRAGVTEGTLYPLLSRLKGLGWVTARLEESNEGPARKYYALTPEGKQTLGQMNQYAKRLLAGLEHTHE